MNKVVTRFIGPFKVLEKVGSIAYRLTLPPYLHKVYNILHVSVVRHYIVDKSHNLQWKELQVSDEGTILVEPLHIL